MEEEFHTFINVTEAGKDLNLPKETMSHIHSYWALKRKVKSTGSEQMMMMRMRMMMMMMMMIDINLDMNLPYSVQSLCGLVLSRVFATIFKTA